MTSLPADSSSTRSLTRPRSSTAASSAFTAPSLTFERSSFIFASCFAV
jgi:hypothetical protein